MFLRTENFRTFLRFYPIVSFLVAIHFILWVWISFGLPGGRYLLETMVGYNMFIGQGEWWRLFTPIVLHASFTHVLFNSFSLVLFGPALERLLGRNKFLLAYIGSALVANIATFLLEPAYFSHVGASGAIYGLFGIYLYMVLFRKDLIDQANSQIIITILIIGLIMTFVGGNINILGHIFGFVGGTILAPLVLPKQRGHHYHASSKPSFSFRKIKARMPRRLDRKSMFWIVLIILVILGMITR
ncbi:membrane associated rhomboid family serine protease [Bacillus mesophilus]|uniref:Rhomboid family intramembrane serine protease n=1 Tax=Bacillus mesophilus TaxID=1808955 RepID=A0A6M0QC46_9BACI|nr:rhomboid family intramembrane serine protease [Bacillus mesophilus]MBM7663139.1 membrane associated rhomboid family serine protease [Bacillus mesophilus]NEY73885.1 rhomboid family intramembrane serine protease [Bacillus mesophilus]